LTYYVYMMANRRNGTLYTGVTNDLIRRAHEHRNGLADGFTRKHRLTRLVWFEVHDEIRAAIEREKRIKRWHRAWKTALIEEANPDWRDLYDDIARP
jgi:putative endonuclease